MFKFFQYHFLINKQGNVYRRFINVTLTIRLLSENA